MKLPSVTHSESACSPAQRSDRLCCYCIWRWSQAFTVSSVFSQSPVVHQRTFSFSTLNAEDRTHDLSRSLSLLCSDCLIKNILVRHGSNAHTTGAFFSSIWHWASKVSKVHSNFFSSQQLFLNKHDDFFFKSINCENEGSCVYLCFTPLASLEASFCTPAAKLLAPHRNPDSAATSRLFVWLCHYWIETRTLGGLEVRLGIESPVKGALVKSLAILDDV